jgi:hypothetical protein
MIYGRMFLNDEIKGDVEGTRHGLLQGTISASARRLLKSQTLNPDEI